jgi:AcrR family transcriptional regulator
MSIEGKDRILDAARRVISRNGIAGATMRGIAQEAEMSTGAIYHYYKSKEEILYDVMDMSLSVSTRMAAETQSSTHQPEVVIEEIYANIIKRFKKNDENRLQFYLAQEAMHGNVELQEKFQKKYRDWIGGTQKLIEILYTKDATKYDKAFATLLIGAIDGVIMQLLMSANPADIQTVCEVYHEILKVGIPNFLDHLAEVEAEAEEKERIA